MYIVLSGGFGNILFQLSYGYYIERNYNINISYLDANHYLLLFFRKLRSVSSHLSHLNDFSEVIPLTRPVTIIELLALSFSRLSNTSFAGVLWSENPPDYSFLSKSIVRSYFQDNSPIHPDFIDFLRLSFNIPQQTTPYIAIHLRITDSSQPPLVLQTYLQSCFSILSSYVHLPIVFVTNNIDAARMYIQDCFKLSRTPTFVSSSPCEDFKILASAEVLVISNSTFSWWASEISPNEQRIFMPSPSLFGQPFDPCTFKHRVIIP